MPALARRAELVCPASLNQLGTELKICPASHHTFFAFSNASSMPPTM
jgi:hypothetical protein